jgi:hypothetical protein
MCIMDHPALTIHYSLTPLLFTRSLPAKSTKYNRPNVVSPSSSFRCDFSFFPSLVSLTDVCFPRNTPRTSTRTMQWLRLECSCTSVLATALAFIPASNNAFASSTLCTGLDVSPRTTTRGWSSSSLPPPLTVKQSLFQQKKTNHLFTKLLVQKK